MSATLHLVKDTAELITDTCDELKEMLLEKNRQYGDSAIKPVRIFSKADTVEQLKVRLDDKISRIARGDNQIESEDVLIDLIGYLVLLLIAQRHA